MRNRHRSGRTSDPLPSLKKAEKNEGMPSLEGVPKNGDLVTIAVIVRPHGIKGELVADLTTDFPDRFANLESVYLQMPSGQIKPISLEDFWFHQHRIVLKLEGCDTRNDAELLRNTKVQIPFDKIVELPEGNYYEFDLIGCKVLLPDGKELGSVQELMPTGAVPVLVVSGDNKSEYLIPFAEDICVEINTIEKLIRINPPEGLLDL